MAREPGRDGEQPSPCETDGESGDSGQTSEERQSDGRRKSRLNRRELLQVGAASAGVAATAGASSLATGRASAATGISFDRTVNAVDDLGMDPTGSQTIDDQLAAVEPGTLVEFPDGTYQLGGVYEVAGDRIGFRGTGDATFRLPDGFNSRFIRTYGADEFLFESIDVDMRGDRSGHMRLHCPSRFHVEDVTYLGRGASTGYAFNVAIESSSGTGTLRNVTVKQGARIDEYNAGNGRIGVWAGGSHVGTLRVERCDMREFGNNALYTSRCSGNVQVVDSYFANNSPASIRISGDGSYAKNCTVRFDLGSYTGPTVTNPYNARGVVIEQKKAYDVPFYDPGALVENCEFEYLDTGDAEPNAQGVIDMWGPSHTLDVRDTTIHVDTDDIPAVRRENPLARKPHRPYQDVISEPHWFRLDNVTITGSAGTGASIVTENADDCEIRNSCLVQSGSNRDGIRFTDADGGVVADTNIGVTGEAVVAENAGVTTKNLTYDDSCDGTSTDQLSRQVRIVADDGADAFEYEVLIDGQADQVTSGDYTATPGADEIIDNGDGTVTLAGVVADGGGDTFRFEGTVLDATLAGPGTFSVDGDVIDPSTYDSTTTDQLSRQVRIVADDGADAFEYEVLIDGQADQVTSGDYTATPGADEIIDNGDGTVTLAGVVANGGGDTFAFEGSVLDATLAGPGTFTVDGAVIDPSTYDSTTSDQLPRQLQVIADVGAEAFEYVAIVDGTAELVTTGEYAATPQVDGVGESVTDNGDGTVTISGIVADGGGDTFAFDGELLHVQLAGAGTVNLDGESIDPADYTLGNELRLVGDDIETSTYAFTVEGALVANPNAGTYDSADNISGSSAEGATLTNTDSYLFSGAILDFQLSGGAAVYLDGRQVDPDAIASGTDPTLPNVIVLDGTGESDVSYKLAVSGAIEDSPDLGPMEASDDLTSGVASGTVSDEVDGFRFSGELTSLLVDGSASVRFES